MSEMQVCYVMAVLVPGVALVVGVLAMLLGGGDEDRGPRD